MARFNGLGGYFKDKTIIGVNEVFCPGFGWVSWKDYDVTKHGEPTHYNVKYTGGIGSGQADMTAAEYEKYQAALNGIFYTSCLAGKDESNVPDCLKCSLKPCPLDQ